MHEHTVNCTEFNSYISDVQSSFTYKLTQALLSSLGYFRRLKPRERAFVEAGEGRVAAFAAFRRFAAKLAAPDASERSYAT